MTRNWPWVVLVLAACGGAASEADRIDKGAGRADTATGHSDGGLGTDGGPDPVASASEYAICDGSDDVRLAIMTGGGQVEVTYQFTNPYGWSFLFVTGRCNFMVNAQGAGGAFLTGTLAKEEAVALSKSMQLAELAGTSYFAQASCPDAPLTQLISATGYAEGGCGDEPPSAIAESLRGAAAALELARAKGQPATGGAELVAIGDFYTKAPSVTGIAWPFSWPIAEASIVWSTTRGGSDFLDHVRVLAGADAELARQLRNDAMAAPSYTGHIDVRAADLDYALFVRDQVDPALQTAIHTFRNASDPSTPKLLTLCETDRVLTGIMLEAPYIYETKLTVDSKTELPCGAEVCWNGKLDAGDPVTASLRLQRPKTTRRCSRPSTSVLADLQPAIDAFHVSFPKRAVVIDTVLAGAPATTSTLRDTAAEHRQCTKLSVDECAQDARCFQVGGRPFDLTRQCTLPTKPLGCQGAGKGCSAALTYGRGPDGTIVQFNSGCQPIDFIAFQPSASDAHTLPACAP